MTLCGQTGAGDGRRRGAGADLALGFARAGAEVVMCGRRVEALERTCGVAFGHPGGGL